MSGHVTILWALLPTYGPVLLALLLAWAGSLASVWRMPRLGNAWGPLAAAVGWAALVPLSWRSMLQPRFAQDFLVLAGFGFVLAEVGRLTTRSRWIGIAAIYFAAWWLAHSPAGRPQFWRVGFGAMAVAWLLGRVGAAQARMAAAVAMTAWFGLHLGGASARWDATAGVMVAAAVGVWLGRRDGVIAPGLTMVGLASAELGSGRLMRGRLGVVDLACIAAIGAPLAVGGFERWLRRWLGSGAGIVAVPAAALSLAGVAWLLNTALRG